MVDRLRAGFERLLESVLFLLMISLAALVAAGVVFRKFNMPIIWYDEVAVIMLAWITYYGAALAALKGAHISVSALVDAMPRGPRIAVTLFGEACVIAFFVLLGWAGWRVLGVLATDYLVTLPKVSNDYVQSVIPIGSACYVLAVLLRLPLVLRGAAARTEVST
ncbi:MAG: TRAP transporter small permease subunit [Burkholderiales bacterium]